MHDLTRFKLNDMIEIGAEWRALGSAAQDFEATAEKVVRCLYDELVDGETGHSACALVRFYATQFYGELAPELQAFAKKKMRGRPVSADMKCLTLMATAGDRVEWNARINSENHQTIPLPSADMVQQLPMIARLFNQIGLDMTTILKPDPALLVDLAHSSFNVFHVPEAAGSPYVPAQEEFVIPYGIESVLGFGGVLPSSQLFAVIMFSKVPISQQVADLFKTLTLSLKLLLLDLDEALVFGET